MMIRPRRILWQVVLAKFEFTRFARLSQAIIMLIYGIAVSEVDWNASRIITLFLMILGGCAVFSGLFILYASFCFFTLEGLEFMNILTDGAREHGKYPFDIYGKTILRFCTFLIPYTLFQYYPFLYLIGRTDNSYYMFFPIISSFFLVPCVIFWSFGVRHYKSTGS